MKKSFKKADILKYEKALLNEKQRILKQGDFADEVMEAAAETDETSSRRKYDAEQGSENYQREMASRLKSLESESLREVDAALRRINEGTFGICERCGKPIPKGRLDVVPHARVCMKCVRQVSGQ